MSDVVTLNASNWKDQVTDSRVPVLVDFFATWCGPCRMLHPTIEAVARRYKGRVTVGELDVDRDRDLAQTYAISAMPTVLIFKPGHAAAEATYVGIRSEEDYCRVLDDLLPLWGY